jgi:hypothetical protein
MLRPFLCVECINGANSVFDHTTLIRINEGYTPLKFKFATILLDCWLLLIYYEERTIQKFHLTLDRLRHPHRCASRGVTPTAMHEQAMSAPHCH